ncbi:MAG: hypothetical protein ACLU5I_01585 [Alistipes finegoldii]
MAGNHPSLHVALLNSSPIDQSDDAPQTASRVDQRICRTATGRDRRDAHQRKTTSSVRR